jgi:hypothetical protein
MKLNSIIIAVLLIDNRVEKVHRQGLLAAGIEYYPEAPVARRVLGVVNHLPEGGELRKLLRLVLAEPVDEAGKFYPVALLFLVDPPAHIFGAHDVFRGLVVVGIEACRIIDMGERIDEVEIKDFMKTPGIVEHQGFFIQVAEDRYELVIILHIPLVRDGIVNILP